MCLQPQRGSPWWHWKSAQVQVGSSGLPATMWDFVGSAGEYTRNPSSVREMTHVSRVCCWFTAFLLLVRFWFAKNQAQRREQAGTHKAGKVAGKDQIEIRQEDRRLLAQPYEKRSDDETKTREALREAGWCIV